MINHERIKNLLDHEPVIRHAIEHGFHWLRFPGALESIYQADQLPILKRRLWRLGVAAAILFLLFAIGDADVFPDLGQQAAWIRLGICIPAILAPLLVMQRITRSHLLQLLVAQTVLAAVAAVLLLVYQSQHINSTYSHASMLFSVLLLLPILRLSFWICLPTVVLSIALYTVVVMQIELMPEIMRSHNVIAMATAAALCLIGIYQLETDFRILYLHQLREQIELAHKQIRQLELEKLSYTDPLTGLANRRWFDTALALEIHRSQRDESPLSLLFIDVDHFKDYNDHYGHQAGDVALREVAQLIQSSSKRQRDLQARYGGEEFVVLLPDTNLYQARLLAEKLRLCIEQQELPHARSPVARHITVSVGVATLNHSIETSAQTLLEQADQALYSAKKNGRNQVC